MSERYVVLGSNSFSGSHFINHALERGADVLGLSRSGEQNPVYLPYRWHAPPTRFAFQQLDLNLDLAETMRAIEAFRPDYVVNFAGQSMVAQSWDQPTHWFQTNVVAQVALHERLRGLSCLRKYVQVGTPEVYGTCEGSVTEAHPFNPSTPYAVSRAACEMSLRTFAQAYKFPVVTTRASNVYGPGQQPYRIIPRTILSARLGKKLPLHGGGASVRSFIHIRDVVEGTRRAALHGGIGEAFHLATDDTISIRDLVERICIRLGLRFEDVVQVTNERTGNDHAYLLDTSKARVQLGWRAGVTLDEGIDETVRWVDAHLDVLKNEPLDYVHKP